MASLHLVRIAEADGRERQNPGIEQAEDSQVAAWVGRLDVGIAGLAAGKTDEDPGGILDHVIVGKDEPRGVNDDAAAECLGNVSWVGEIELAPPEQYVLGG